MLPLLLLAVSALLSTASGLLSDAECPQNVTVKQDFSLKDYQGRWYEIKRYEQFYEQGLDCVVAEYQPQADGGFSIKNGAYNLANSSEVVAVGTGVMSFPDEPVPQGKLNVAFFGAKPDRSNYWVVDTDYTSYSLVWSCEPYYKDPAKNVVGFWVFARQPSFPTDEADVRHVDALIKKYADETKFVVPNHSDARCPRSY